MKPRIVFFGTGPVSLACLEGIYDAFEIEAIITKPDRVAPNGRTHEHPVRSWAEAHAIVLHQVASKAALTELFERQQFSSTTGLVVDFGMIIPEGVIATFTKGIINSHFSLLPLLRGADPISFAILEGHERTGVSLMKIVAELDEGDLIAQEPYELPASVTTPELTAKLSDISNALLREYLPRYIDGEIEPWPQNATIAPTYTRKLSKADGELDWRKPAATLEREVRALIGWPGSRTALFDRPVTVTAARVVSASEIPEEADQAIGSVVRVWPDRLVVATGEGALEILQLTPAGKRPMGAASFLRGLPTD